MKEIIISVGAGPQQLPFIKRVKELGYCIASFGKGANSREAIKISDYYAEIDTRDDKAAINWINSLEVKVLAIGSFAGGGAIPTVQKLSNYYKVPTQIPNKLIVGKDKVRQQKLLEEYELSSICTWNVSEISEAVIQSYKNELFIVKPITGRGSKGVLTVNGSELLEFCSKNNTSIDEYMVQLIRKGIEYRCLMIVQSGELKLFMPTIRKSYHSTAMIGQLYYCNKDEARLQQYIYDFIKKSGIKNTIFKADIIVSEDRIDMLEMDIGVPGGIPFVSFASSLFGRNILDEFIKLITNQSIDTFEIINPDIKMEFIYNQAEYPVIYDLDVCRQVLQEKYGTCQIIVNPTHPESKGGYVSNADHIMSVIYEDKIPDIGEFINKYLFHRT